jgi:hypothetical protein
MNRRPHASALRLVALIGLVLLLAGCTVGSDASPSGQSAIPAPTPSNLHVNEADNGHTVTVGVGSEITLELANTYWQVQASSDPAVLALVSGPTASGAGPSACLPGMGCGIVTATFRALTPGQATITASRTTCGEALLCTGSAGAYAVTIVVSTASAPSSASPVASPEVVCDKLATPAEGALPSQPNPTPSLTCGTALAAALAMLGPAHPPIIREEFRWGGLCPPGAPCVPPLGDQGIVIIDFASGPAVFVYVSAAPGGAVAASSPAPYPSGY